MADDTPTFTPYANESEVVRIGEMEIGNRVDRVSINGDLVLTKDQAGLALAKDLQALVNKIVRALDAEKDLPERVQVIDAKTVKNPFA